MLMGVYRKLYCLAFCLLKSCAMHHTYANRMFLYHELYGAVHKQVSAVALVGK